MPCQTSGLAATKLQRFISGQTARVTWQKRPGRQQLKSARLTGPLWSTYTDCSTTTAWPQNSSYVVDGKHISLVLYRVAVSNSHKRQNSVGTSVCRRLTLVSSTHTQKKKNANQQSVSNHTGRNATLPVWNRGVVVACAQLQLDCHCHYRYLIVVCHYFVALVDCRLQSTWACSQLQLSVDLSDMKCQYERRASDKLQNKRSHAVRVSCLRPRPDKQQEDWS